MYHALEDGFQEEYTKQMNQYRSNPQPSPELSTVVAITSPYTLYNLRLPAALKKQQTLWTNQFEFMNRILFSERQIVFRHHFSNKPYGMFDASNIVEIFQGIPPLDRLIKCNPTFHWNMMIHQTISIGYGKRLLSIILQNETIVWWLCSDENDRNVLQKNLLQWIYRFGIGVQMIPKSKLT